MIPIRDHNPSGKKPVINYILIAVNVLIFSYLFVLPKNLLMKLIDQYALVPSLIISGRSLFSLISSMFLHASIAHLVGNMLFLNIFGDNLEDTLGHFKYLVLFPRHKIDVLFSFGWTLRRVSVPAYFMLFYWFVAQVFSGVGSLTFTNQAIGGVAYFAHVGGFVSGWLLINLFRLAKDDRL